MGIAWAPGDQDAGMVLGLGSSQSALSLPEACTMELYFGSLHVLLPDILENTIQTGHPKNMNFQGEAPT